MTTATFTCVPTAVLKANITRQSDRWTTPDLAASCVEASVAAVRAAGDPAGIKALFQGFLLGLAGSFLRFSVSQYKIHWRSGHASFETELKEQPSDGTSITVTFAQQGAVMVTPARVALMAVLTARNAAIEGDYMAVDAFAGDVLGIARPESCRDGVIAALLGDWVHRLGCYLTDPELLRIVHEYTAAERRRWRPLWERRANGGRVWMTGATIADGITLDDILPEHHTPEDLAMHYQLGDERVCAVLRGLTSDEAAVAARWAQGAGTWAESALSVRLPAAYGERVRRKLHRLGARQAERAFATGVSSE